MAHNLSGIITSFKYSGELPNIILIGNFHFIPLSNDVSPSYSEPTLDPYDNLTKEWRKRLKELSFYGKCIYIETLYHGGPGRQLSETWENGERIEGPLYSSDGITDPKVPDNTLEVEDSINQSLRNIGIYRHEGLDEFDTVRLGWYRSNDEVLEEYRHAQSGKAK